MQPAFQQELTQRMYQLTAPRTVQRILVTGEDAPNSVSRSSEPSGRIDGQGNDAGSWRRRRQSEHGCGCRSFCMGSTAATTQGDVTGAKQELEAWLQHMQDVSYHRAADKPHSGGTTNRSLHQEHTEEQQPPSQEERQQQQSRMYVLGCEKMSPVDHSNLHRKLSAMIGDDGLPLPAFAILSVLHAGNTAVVHE